MLAEELKARFVPRKRRSLERICTEYKEKDVLTVAERELRYYTIGAGDASPLFFHPSMAAVRLKRLAMGQGDNLLNACSIEKGDYVLDCTAGMASDSIVFAYAVGDQGKVVALESDPIIALITREGLHTYTSEIDGLTAAMRRIRLEHTDHLEKLRSLPDGSFDVVYFDPMFRQAKQDSSWIKPLRKLANHDPLSLEAFREAYRVARKRVVVKELRGSSEFSRLGISAIQNYSGDISYGVKER